MKQIGPLDDHLSRLARVPAPEGTPVDTLLGDFHARLAADLRRQAQKRTWWLISLGTLVLLAAAVTLPWMGARFFDRGRGTPVELTLKDLPIQQELRFEHGARLEARPGIAVVFSKNSMARVSANRTNGLNLSLVTGAVTVSNTLGDAYRCRIRADVWIIEEIGTIYTVDADHERFTVVVLDGAVRISNTINGTHERLAPGRPRSYARSAEVPPEPMIPVHVPPETWLPETPAPIPPSRTDFPDATNRPRTPAHLIPDGTSPIPGGETLSVAGRITLEGSPMAGVTVLLTTNRWLFGATYASERAPTGLRPRGYAQARSGKDGLFEITGPRVGTNVFVFAWKDGDGDGTFGAGDLSSGYYSFGGMAGGAGERRTNIALGYVFLLRIPVRWTGISTTANPWMTAHYRLQAPYQVFGAISGVPLRVKSPDGEAICHSLLVATPRTLRLRAHMFVDLEKTGKAGKGNPFDGHREDEEITWREGDAEASTLEAHGLWIRGAQE